MALQKINDFLEKNERIVEADKRCIETVIRLKPRSDNVQIVPICDLHVGHPGYKETVFEKAAEYILNTKNVWWFGGGDLFENAAISRYATSECMNTREQRHRLQEMLSPLASKCIGLIDGNHEERLLNKQGDLYIEILAEIVGVPYLGQELTLVVSAPGRTYKIYGFHSKIASKTPGLAQNVNERDIEKWIGDTDVMYRFHNHYRDVQIVRFMTIDATNLVKTWHDRAFVLGGSAMDRARYLTNKARRPAKLGFAGVELEMRSNKERNIKEIYV